MELFDTHFHLDDAAPEAVMAAIRAEAWAQASFREMPAGFASIDPSLLVQFSS